MHVGLLLQMAADGMGDRIALGSRADGITMAQMATQARRAGTILSGMPGARVALVDLNSEAVPIYALFGSALAGKPFVPINYRLSDEQLRDLVRLTAPATVIVGEGVVDRLGPIPGIELIERKEFLERTTDPAVEEVDPYGGDPDSVAVLLFTSGTTGAPKAAVLRNRNLTSYVISTLSSPVPERTNRPLSACLRTTSPAFPRCCRRPTRGDGWCTSRRSSPTSGSTWCGPSQ